MIRCLAVDDEAYAAEIIGNYIRKTPFLTLTGTCTNAFDALNLVEQKKVDLIFLDIQMPELTGIQFLKLCGADCKVILTTAYSEYALDGFELDVVDYLLKPVSYERFYKAAQKAQDMLSSTKKQVLPNGGEPHDFIFVKGDTKNKFIKINYADILYVEGLKNYVSIYTTTQRIITYQTLRELEEILPKPAFYRVHRSYIVATAHINMVDGKQISIAAQTIPIGETYAEDFFRRIRDTY